MYYVYIIKSVEGSQTYVGFTRKLQQRVLKHNQGGSTHTSKYRPWKLIWCCAFPDKLKAIAFESYLKSHSGKAFTNKRLIA